MKWPRPLIPGVLRKRYKRFLADVTLADGTEVTAHCPNTGSMAGCAAPGSPVYLSPADNPDRKLKFTWELVEADGALVGVNTGRANGIVAEGIEAGVITETGPFERIRREVKYGRNSRIDLLLEQGDHNTYVEVKNTTLADGGAARFPDAVTERGRKHMEELADMVRQGHRAAVVFLVHRGDCGHFEPADHIDPAYGAALRAAADAGVLVLPYRARVTPEEVTIEKRLPARL